MELIDKGKKRKIENFSNREKIKRILLAKDLSAKGYSVKEIASNFNVSEETINSYLKEESHEFKQTKLGESKPISKLTDFLNNSVTSKEYFKDLDKDKEGFICPLCRRYTKFLYGIVFSKDKHVCRVCYEKMTANDIEIIMKY